MNFKNKFPFVQQKQQTMILKLGVKRKKTSRHPETEQFLVGLCYMFLIHTHVYLVEEFTYAAYLLN